MSEIRKRLHGPSLLGTTAATKYTVPSNTKTVVRSIYVNAVSGQSDSFTLSVGTDAAGTRLFDAVAVSTYLILEVFLALEEGEIIQAFAGEANQLSLTLNGEEIVLG